MRLLSVGLLLLASGFTFAEEQVKLPEKEQFHLFLLVGQSNMAGRGKVEAQNKKTHPRVLMLNKSTEWVPASDPLHFDKPVAGVGLGMTFGIQIAESDPKIIVGLIPCAVGGSPIDSWQAGEFYAPTKSHPWDDAVKRTNLALKSGQLKGILWHQGESDATEKLAPAYEKKLNDLIGRFRKEFNAPEVPFLIGQLGNFEGVTWNAHQKQIDLAHRTVSKEVKNAIFISSEGLKHNPDKIHFDAESLRTFGKRYAEGYLKLIGK
jgi:hypothetical protein